MKISQLRFYVRVIMLAGEIIEMLFGHYLMTNPTKFDTYVMTLNVKILVPF